MGMEKVILAVSVYYNIAFLLQCFDYLLLQRGGVNN